MNMARSDWNSYRLEDGLNIWGDPNFQGSPNFLGGFELGDAITDTLVLKGRVATGSIAGSTLDIDATYTYGEFMELRMDVSDWTGIPGTTPKNFYGRYMRVSTSVASANWLYAQQVYAANGLEGEAGVDVALLQSFIYNTMGKGGSTITLMRGGEIKCEWAADDIVTNAQGLRIEFMGLAAPSNTIHGLWFEQDSGAAATYDLIQEIRMKQGMTILSRATSPNGVITAPIGSLCLVSSGTGANDSLFINRDGATSWKYITVEA